MSMRSYGMVGKTYTNASEAFKDADYATPIWRCETDYDRTIRLLKDLFWFGILLSIVVGGIFLVYPYFE